jgi:hypothetical protein
MDYDLQTLEHDLSMDDRITQKITTTIRTNKHNKPFEGTYSFSDLGLVIERVGELHGAIDRTAVLIQAKRLFADSQRFNARSKYKYVDFAQLQNLMALQAITNQHPAHFKCACYFFYGPTLTSTDWGAKDELAHILGERERKRIDPRYYRHRLPEVPIAPAKENLGILAVQAAGLFCECFTHTSADLAIHGWYAGDDVRSCWLREKYKHHALTLKDVLEYDGTTMFESFMMGLLSKGGCTSQSIIDIASGMPPISDRPWATRFTITIRIEPSWDGESDRPSKQTDSR